MIPLFAYGTLRSTAYQRALFDRDYPTRPATLAGWRVVVAEGGYFTVTPERRAIARGVLVELDAAALAIADEWEDVPTYERIRVRAHDVDRGPVDAWLYVRPTPLRTEPPPGALALHDDAAVLAAIRAFRSRGTG
jgi:gamma-glutamylcyclotransferase (GGCT)/AIG2-like uncharacterized protein YtfP